MKGTTVANDYTCPSCSSPIPMEDINVSTDIALCRKCGKASSFSTLCNVPNTLAVLSKPPPRSVKIERDMMGGGTTLTYRHISWGALLFLVPFTALWALGSIFCIYRSPIRTGVFQWAPSLFGIPILIGTIVPFAAILFSLFGRWVITLNSGQGTVFSGIGKLGRKRKFVYNRNTSVTLLYSNTRVNGKQLEVITLKTDNTQFAFGGFIKDDAKGFILAALIREFRR